jgi:ABC-type multidrug transport system fused ATPase/permease subunit
LQSQGSPLLRLQALIATQCFSIPSKLQYDTRFRLAKLGLVSSAIQLASLVTRYGPGVVRAFQHYHGDSQDLASAACCLLEILAALAAGLSFSAFPHRPDVYYQGGLIDQQHAVSLLTRLTFSWNRLVFDISKERQLVQDDLPNMDGNTRSSQVYARYLEKNPQGRLWWRLVKTFKYPLAIQWSLTVVQAVLALFPQYVLHNFLEALERPPDQRANYSELWGWVIGMATSMILQIWVSSTQRWNTSSRLEAPLLSLLQSLVFQKALRQDEAADPGQTEEKSPDSESPEGQEKNKKPKSDTRQAVVNHIKLDSGRINIFCTYNFWFPLATLKLFLAGSYLITLLGWKALFSGLAAAIFVLPVSHLMSKKYGKIQFGLMAFRDAKTHVLTEALHGMRQIKYSALEELYEKKILKARDAELAQYWRVTLWMCALNSVVFLGPLMLSCVSLAVYAYTSRVRPSVIFASLGLFDQLDEAIGLLPVIQVYLMEAWTSCVRLEKYLNQLDKEPVSEPANNITFNDATVRWPKAEDADGVLVVAENETRSILRNVTLDFPSGEFSVITGKTGAGKSLLLAAVLGEVKLVSGTVNVPAPPPQAEIDSEDVKDADWILPTLTSFVSQTPWIESGTVRENIIFGFPYRQARYKKVLSACALEKDVELLIDGDQTEVGPKGVTLSGGQRWRVALARALYSRAGILILDDVLSAVDAHVGRTIVAEALTGELAEGRTRILATHHAEMCLPKASYLVRLRNGRLEKAEQINDDHLEVSSGTMGQSSTTVSVNGDTALDAQDGKKTMDSDDTGHAPTKIIKEESREEGRVKWHVYKTYIKSSRAWYLWVITVVLLFCGRTLGVLVTWSLKELSETYSTENYFRKLFRQGVDIAQTYINDRPFEAEAMRQRSANFWIAAYVLLSISQVLIGILNRIVIFIIGLRASRSLFEKMTHTVLRTPLRWADTMPIGRIINRFTQDTFIIDRRLSPELISLFVNVVSLFVIIGTR